MLSKTVVVPSLQSGTSATETGGPKRTNMHKFIRAASRSLATIVAIGSAQAAMAAPPPESPWDLEQTFVSGGTVTAAMPWQSRYATGTNCENDQGLLTVPWARDSGKLQGRNAPSIDPAGGASNPVIFKNVSPGNSSPPGWGLTFAKNQVGMTVSVNRCAVLRFVAPVDGMYKVSGEFFSPINSVPNLPNAATNKVTAFVRSGTQQVGGLVDKPGGIQSWSIPGSPVYALQAGQFIDYAVRDAGNGTLNDVAMLSTRVTWIDNLPPQPATFKASDFDFEGRHGCAIEQGTNKLYCWGQGTASARVLGRTGAAVNENKLVLATELDTFLTTNNLGQAARIQVGATSNCVRTDGAKTVCFGLNDQLESGAASGNSAIRDVTAQLGAHNGLRVDASSACILKAGGMVHCWGSNNDPSSTGTLGHKNGAWNHSAIPLVAVPNVSGATDVSPGKRLSCAVVDNMVGKVTCWGNDASNWNQLGLMGNGSGPANFPDPDIYFGRVKTANGADLTGVKKIVVNGVRACGLQTSGQLFCWGLETAYGITTGVPGAMIANARQIGFPVDVTDFAISGSAICVVAGAGAKVFCQGHNVYGEVGRLPVGSGNMFTFNTALAGTYGGNIVTANVTAGNIPASVAGLAQIKKIRGGHDGFCALKSDGAILCWGGGTVGQLGNGSSVSSSSPVVVIK